MTIKPGAIRFNTDSMKLEIFRGADTGDYSGPVEDVVAYSGTSLFWDDSPIGAFTLSNNNRTATTNDGNGGSYTNGDVYSTAIAAGNTYAWTLRVTNGDTTGGWYFTDSQTASGTHADQRNESSGNASGLRGGETGASTYGDYATANGTSSAQNQIALNADVSPNGSKNIEFVVYRPGSGTGKVWIRAEGAGSWIGGGDPNNTSSTATIVLPDATTYFGFVQYDRSTAATFILDIESSGGYYGPQLSGQWEEIAATSPELETGGARGLFAGGNSTPFGDTVEYITISTKGDAIDFGDLTKRRQESAGFSSRTRALWAGDAVPGSDNTIDAVNIASGGNAIDFGNLVSLTDNAQGFGSLATATRGLFAGAYNAPDGRRNTIQSIEIATNGDAITFGELSGGSNSNPTGACNATRGLVMGGSLSSGNTNVIQYITISTNSNSLDFGDLTLADLAGGGSANATRALFFESAGATINYITISTLGNASDFGDLTSATNHYAGGSPSSCTRACYGGGGFPSTTDVIDTVEIMTLGNSTDFGNLVGARNLMMRGNCSNGHGGL